MIAGQPVWLEGGVERAVGRALQPRMPITVGELVADGSACAKAGVAIVHVHAYDERTGRQRDDVETATALKAAASTRT